MQVNVNWTGVIRTKGGTASAGWARRRLWLAAGTCRWAAASRGRAPPRDPPPDPARDTPASVPAEPSPCLRRTTSCAGEPLGGRALDERFVTFTPGPRQVYARRIDHFFLYMCFYFDFRVFDFVTHIDSVKILK